MKNKFKINGPIFIGRSHAEYMKMFNLKKKDLDKKILLDCAAGASSFTAHMNREGYKVTAVDILYDQEANILQKKCQKHMKILVDALSDVDNHFIWDFFRDLKDLQDQRMTACREFSKDYKINRKNYVKADLTHLPFNDNSFNLALCSHLLFIYDHRLNYDFHLKSIEEMLRVSSEVRIYPLVKHKNEKSSFVSQIMADLKETADVEIVKVDYEFREGGNEMIRLFHKK